MRLRSGNDWEHATDYQIEREFFLAVESHNESRRSDRNLQWPILIEISNIRVALRLIDALPPGYIRVVITNLVPNNECWGILETEYGRYAALEIIWPHPN